MVAVQVVEMIIFVPIMFVGFEIVTKIPPLLYTSPVSGTSATSGIAIVLKTDKAAWGFFMF